MAVAFGSIGGNASVCFLHSLGQRFGSGIRYQSILGAVIYS